MIEFLILLLVLGWIFGAMFAIFSIGGGIIHVLLIGALALFIIRLVNGGEKS